ncbi:hypothetical protein CC78DRAFT_437780, partial [Lojkania enalia]
YIKFLRNYDWTKTVIGPMEGWSLIVRQYVFFIMSNPEARAIFLGHDDPTLIYNEACGILIGDLHPRALGVSGSVGASHSWEYKYKGIKKTLRTGIPDRDYDHYHPVARNGLELEEAYFSWNTMPLMDDRGCIFGVLKEFYDTSSKVISHRRDKTRHMAEQMADPMTQADNMETFWAQVLDVFDLNPQDFPFCAIYSSPEDLDSRNTGTSTLQDTMPSSLKLEGTVGLKKGHSLVTEFLDVMNMDNPLMKPFRAAWISSKPVPLMSKDGTLPELLRVRIEGRGHGATCNSAVIYPIRRVDCPGPVGILLLGLNPQRHFDGPFRSFLSSIFDQFVKAAAAILVPEEHGKLLEEREKAKEQERIFGKLAEHAPVGIAVFGPTGSPQFVNPTYLALSNVTHQEDLPPRSMEMVHPNDREQLREDFAIFLSSEQTKFRNFQYRVQYPPPQAADASPSSQWRTILAYAWSEPEGDGYLKWVSLTDITSNEKARIEDALEIRQQSENFIDMTCHEMRNPLSAIIQSADGIITSFDSNFSASPEMLSDDAQSSILDSVQTIMLCAQHQKRIVDDILTLSKLEGNLLQISPECYRPVLLVEKAIQMYEAELADAKITPKLEIKDSYHTIGIDFVMVDTSRLLQILINLLTNAIKFTRRADGAKEVSVVLGASKTPPSAGTCNVSFIPPRGPRPDIVSQPEWGKGEDVYLQFDVCDTGEGLTPEQMKSLFMRFSQATAKTYSKYGGSGLGLFISRELTELQGGRIGVHSVAGQGSTFAFYIKVRKYRPDCLEEDLVSDIPNHEVPSGVQPVKDSVSASLAYTEAAARDISSTTIGFGNLTTPTLPTDLHILLVEDNLINQKVTAVQLRKMGCTVHVANHGIDCLKFLEKSSFFRTEPDMNTPLSVILLDLEMPVMNGLTCVRRIREMQQTGELVEHVPVIACTGNARREQTVHAIETGMDDVVTKPFRINELLPKCYDLI